MMMKMMVMIRMKAVVVVVVVVMIMTRMMTMVMTMMRQIMMIMMIMMMMILNQFLHACGMPFPLFCTYCILQGHYLVSFCNKCPLHMQVSATANRF